MTKPIWDWNIPVPTPSGGSGTFLVLFVGLLMLTTTTGMLASFEIVEETEHGVVVDSTGEIQRVAESGYHFTIPVFEEMETIPKTTTVVSETGVLTSEGTSLTVEYQTHRTVADDEVREFYRMYGSDDDRATSIYAEPCARANLRNTSAQHDAETLYTNPSLFQDAVDTCDNAQFDVQVRQVEVPASEQ